VLPEADASALPEIEHAIGATRQAVLDHFLDTEGDQSMAQIKAALSNVLPGTVEACVHREWQQGRLLRISPGVYRLAPARPVEPPKPPSPPPPPTPGDEAMWFEALERWAVDRSWDTELGPPPDQPNNIPADIKGAFQRSPAEAPGAPPGT
jgi:hypothetical protein